MDLRSLRKEKGYTIQQVSDGTGLPPTSLKYWEKGERQPAADVLPKLAEFYGITTDELLGYKAPNMPAALEEHEETEYEIKDEHGLVKRNVEIEELENAIRKDLSDAKKSFFKIGYKLTLIQRYAMFRALGYQNLADYAEDKFGFGKTTTYNLLNVYELTHSAIYPAEMDEQFLPYEQSKLVELSACCDKWRKEKLMSVVSPTDSVKDIKEYVKLWNKTCYDNNYIYPEGATVKEALAIAAEEKAAKEQAKALPQPTAIPDDVPPGQMSIFDEEESERPFDEPQVESPEEPEDEFGGQEFEEVGESYSTPGVSMAFVNMAEESEKEFNEAALFLKNDTERKEFLRSAENFNISVLRNAELGLEITKRVLRNGATIYRTQFRMYSEYHKKFVDDTVLCLVDPKEEMPSRWSYEPQRNYMSYTLTGTAETYIVQYLSKHKDEI